MADRKHVVIAGAGLAGALLACLLGRRGWRVDVYERRPDPRAKGFVGGRSINLALSVRGLTALDRAGLAERVLEDAIPMPGRLMHGPDASTTWQPYSKDPTEAINSVSRGGLNITLLDEGEAIDGVTLHFARRVLDVDLDRPALVVEREGGEPERVQCDLLVGADGAFSAVRSAMQKTDRFDYSQSYLEHGYKELEIPPTEDGEFALEPEALHIWPRGGSMMIALPNADRTFTCTLFWPLEGPRSFAELDPDDHDDEAILAHFRERYPDAVPLMPTLVEDYRRNPVASLVTIRCDPWHHGDRVVLVGDSAHAIVPFYGQGMNAAFEDVRILDEMLEAAGDDPAQVLADYTARRKPNGDAIADLALANFIEMRDKVASPLFLARKRVEKVLHRLMPGRFVPLYNLVSFSNVPYDEARRRARRQETRLAWASSVFAGLVLLLLLVMIL